MQLTSLYGVVRPLIAAVLMQFLFLNLTHAAAQENAGLNSLSRYLLDDCFGEILDESRPRRRIGPDGAVGGNRPESLALENQVSGFVWVRRGIFASNPGWTEAGWKILDWGLAQTPGTSADGIHQTTRFLDAVTSAMAIDPSGATAMRKASLTAHLRWLTSEQNSRHAIQANQLFTHRTWMRASLFETSSLLLDAPYLHQLSLENVAQAISQQRSDGAFPERGGIDVGYHIFGILYQLQWIVVADPSQPLHGAALSSLGRGLGWYRERVDQQGVIDRSNSTRMLQERGHGRDAAKDVNYARAIEVLIGGSVATGDRRWLDLAASLSGGGVADGRIPSDFERRFARQPGGDLPRTLVAACTAY